MNDITTDYEPYLRVTEGNIWWVLMDAIRLGASWRPVRDKRRSLVTELRAPDNYAPDNVRTLLGAFRDDSLGIERPTNFEREGICFVEAEEFLDWLAQYITREQATEITFPSELGLEVRLAKAKAAASCSLDDGQEFESLELALEGWFDKKLNELPDELRQRVEQWLPGSTLWDDLSVEQRRTGARNRDYWYDPATKQEREDQWKSDERKRKRLRELQEEIEECKSIKPLTTEDLKSKKSHLKKLRQEEEQAGGKAPSTLNPSERKSLVKLVFAMATDCYGYDPGDKKSPVTQDILNAAAKADLSISPDTVRKWLKEGAKLREEDL